MHRSARVILFLMWFSSVLAGQTITGTILPQCIEGMSGTNSNRVPLAYRAKLTGLTPNSSYRFFNQVITSADGPTTSGAGNCIFASPSGNFVRTSSPGLSTAGTYGTFTTSSSGSFEGWFITEPTGNARFTPGRYVFMRIMLNDGISGTSVALRLTIPDSIRVIKLDAAPGDSTGTGLRCTSKAAARDFIFAFDNTAGTGRPVAGSFVEDDGTDNTTSSSYAAFYASGVNAINGAFGLAIPNLLPNGIRRVERWSLTSGTVVSSSTSVNGLWPSGASTVNPSGGTTEIVLSASDVSLLTVIASPTQLPPGIALAQNYPNPFNPATHINFALPEAAQVRLCVYDILGRQIATLVDGECSAGFHSVVFDARGLASGSYIYTLRAAGSIVSRSLVLTK
ncbi:MAG TPA: T9SS type A sorting domain-containing protein [Bacteroidota bacterium]|nr:T9SS type A sorting domain-containing protein [Bacteroidota bacterium]